jgi:hypothetical protein
MSFRAASSDIDGSSLPRSPCVATAIAALALSGIASAGSAYVLGPTLGLVFAGFAIATLVAPAFVVGRVRGGEMCRAILVTIAISLPVLAAWTWATFAGRAMTPNAAAQVVGVFVSYTAMLSFTTAAMRRLVPWGLASGLTTLLAAAWLSWPVWTTAWMTERLAATLIRAHPLFAANAAGGFPPWPEHGVIYGMTRLGQDIAYAMPDSPLPAMALNGAIVAGAILLAISLATTTVTLSWWRRKRRVIKPL